VEAAGAEVVGFKSRILFQRALLDGFTAIRGGPHVNSSVYCNGMRVGLLGCTQLGRFNAEAQSSAGRCFHLRISVAFCESSAKRPNWPRGLGSLIQEASLPGLGERFWHFKTAHPKIHYL